MEYLIRTYSNEGKKMATELLKWRKAAKDAASAKAQAAAAGVTSYPWSYGATNGSVP